MKTIWKGSKTGSRVKNPEYEVMISVTSSKNRTADKSEWEKSRQNLYFRNNAFDLIESEGYMFLMVTPIAPNSDRMYFKFLKENEGNGAIRIVKSTTGPSYCASCSFDSKTEYEVVKAYWQKEYDIKFDVNEKYYYIDVVNPRVDRKWK